MALEGSVMQMATGASCRACHMQSWSGVERCNRGKLASTSSKVGEIVHAASGITPCQMLPKSRKKFTILSVWDPQIPASELKPAISIAAVISL